MYYTVRDAGGLWAPCLGDKAVYESTTSFCGHDCGARICGASFIFASASFGRNLDRDPTATDPGLLRTRPTRTQLRVGTGLLGVGTRRLLLGARHLGVRAAVRVVLDARLLELERNRLRVYRGLLGPASRLLRRHQLRRRVLGERVRRWLLAAQLIRLQRVRRQRKPQRRRRKRLLSQLSAPNVSRQLRRRTWRIANASYAATSDLHARASLSADFCAGSTCADRRAKPRLLLACQRWTSAQRGCRASVHAGNAPRELQAANAARSHRGTSRVRGHAATATYHAPAALRTASAMHSMRQCSTLRQCNNTRRCSTPRQCSSTLLCTTLRQCNSMLPCSTLPRCNMHLRCSTLRPCSNMQRRSTPRLSTRLHSMPRHKAIRNNNSTRKKRKIKSPAPAGLFRLLRIESACVVRSLSTT